jgi:hypothetical protein
MGFLCIDLDLDFTTVIPQLYTTRSPPPTHMLMNLIHEHSRSCTIKPRSLELFNFLDVQEVNNPGQRHGKQSLKAGAILLVQSEAPIDGIHAECSASARAVVEMMSAWLCTP